MNRLFSHTPGRICGGRMNGAVKGHELPWAETATNSWLGVSLADGVGWISPAMAEVIDP